MVELGEVLGLLVERVGELIGRVLIVSAPYLVFILEVLKVVVVLFLRRSNRLSNQRWLV